MCSVINLKWNCWNSGLVRKCQCQNRSTVLVLIAHFPSKKTTSRSSKWERSEFQRNSTVMFVQDAHTHTLFEILVYYRAISFHHPTNEYLFSLNGWRYPETDSSVCDDFYQFVVSLNGLPLLERSKVSKIQKSHIIWNGLKMSLTNEMMWIIICRIEFLDYAKFAFRV